MAGSVRESSAKLELFCMRRAEGRECGESRDQEVTRHKRKMWWGEEELQRRVGEVGVSQGVGGACEKRSTCAGVSKAT